MTDAMQLLLALNAWAGGVAATLLYYEVERKRFAGVAACGTLTLILAVVVLSLIFA